jgi:hypothetical protein
VCLLRARANDNPFYGMCSCRPTQARGNDVLGKKASSGRSRPQVLFPKDSLRWCCTSLCAVKIACSVCVSIVAECFDCFAAPRDCTVCSISPPLSSTSRNHSFRCCAASVPSASTCFGLPFLPTLLLADSADHTTTCCSHSLRRGLGDLHLACRPCVPSIVDVRLAATSA